MESQPQNPEFRNNPEKKITHAHMNNQSSRTSSSKVIANVIGGGGGAKKSADNHEDMQNF